ncbi:MAG: acetyl-CoA C-acetyltransferase [Thermomicrobiales bacterium]|nr:acetyl-CoA C-acetyltransferase [Thermomicrobiales bacterium]
MSDATHSAVILGGARTPFGKLGGALASQSAVELGAAAAIAALERSGVSPNDIEETIFGQVLQGGAGQNPARQVALRAGVPIDVPAETINRVCGSGMRAITLADSLIRIGDFEVILAGGMESMSNAPYLLRKARFGYRMGGGELEDMMISDGLWCAIEGCHMGIHGGNVAAEEGVSREEQDAFALRSHQRAIAAEDAGLLSREIVPVEIADKRGTATVDRDEAPRRDTSDEALARLKPAFAADGSVTAGNAPGVNDGAAAVIVTSRDWASAQGLSPKARILAHAAAAWNAPYLAYTPAMAAEKALAKAGLQVSDVDLWEINEAFASVPIISARRLGVDLDRVNVNGGAIALGHPIGASGARIVLTLIEELRRRGGGIGVAAICSGGGGGDAIVLEVPGAA